jgi:hypothetical protein
LEEESPCVEAINCLIGKYCFLATYIGGYWHQVAVL